MKYFSIISSSEQTETKSVTSLQGQFYRFILVFINVLAINMETPGVSLLKNMDFTEVVLPKAEM